MTLKEGQRKGKRLGHTREQTVRKRNTEAKKAVQDALKDKKLEILAKAALEGKVEQELDRREKYEQSKEPPKKIAFIPDYDPDLTVEQNLENIKTNPGKQARFLSSSEDEVLYAGGRGSAKSTAMIVDPLPNCDNPNFRGLVLRRTMPELRELIARAKSLYEAAYSKVKWNEQEKIFRFPSGAKIEFGYCDNEQDLERYRGQEFQWIGVDEIAQFPGPWIIDRLKGSMRTTDSTIKIAFRCTANPIGAGRGWLKKRFQIKFNKDTGKGNFEQTIRTPVQTALGVMYITRKWFHSTVYDNKVLIKTNPMYVASLASQTNVAMRAAELEGSWDDVVGLAFPEFNEDVHVVQSFPVPQAWYKWRSCDWGYTTMASCLWFTMDWDNNIYVYRELTTTGVNAEEFAQLINELEVDETVGIGYLASDAFSTRGQVGETPGDTLLRINRNWTPADRGPNSRKADKLLVHRYLATKEDGNGVLSSRLKIFASCLELIDELGTLTLNPDNPEDIDLRKKYSQNDHSYDALRYGFQAVPDIGTQVNTSFIDKFKEEPQEDNPIMIDSTFGY